MRGGRRGGVRLPRLTRCYTGPVIEGTGCERPRSAFQVDVFHKRAENGAPLTQARAGRETSAGPGLTVCGVAVSVSISSCVSQTFPVV